MDTILKQLSLETENDVLQAHRFSMEIGKRFKLSIPEQINFSCRVAEHSLLVYGTGEKIVFSLHLFEDRYIIRAATKKNQGRILVETTNNITADTLIEAEAKQETNLDIQQFAVALSHELKNSIAKISMAVSLAEQEPLTPVVTSYIDIVHRASSRLNTTLSSLNDIMKLGYAEVVKIILPYEIFKEVYDEFAYSMDPDSRIEVNFAAVNELNYIDIYLRSIFSNVISNAIKYADPQRPLKLQATAIREGDYTKFSFIDNGQGMDLQKTRDKLFKPFQRFSPDKEGTGIGLYLVRKMTEHNGGKIEVESEPGAGTSFHFFIKEY